ATILSGGYLLLKQHDLKLLLALATASKLAFILLVVSQPDRTVARSGRALLAAHGLVNSALILTVAAVAAPSVTCAQPVLAVMAPSAASVAGFLATFSMSGLPPFAGFVGKEAALEALTHDGGTHQLAVLLIVVAGSVPTFAYGMRFLWGAFGRKPDRSPTRLDHEAAGLFIPGLLLAGAGLL